MANHVTVVVHSEATTPPHFASNDVYVRVKHALNSMPHALHLMPAANIVEVLPLCYMCD